MCRGWGRWKDEKNKTAILFFIYFNYISLMVMCKLLKKNSN